MLQVFDHHYVIIYLICKKIDIKDINLREGLSSWVLFRSHFSIAEYFSNIVLPKTVKYNPRIIFIIQLDGVSENNQSKDIIVHLIQKISNILEGSFKWACEHVVSQTQNKTNIYIWVPQNVPT